LKSKGLLSVTVIALLFCLFITDSAKGQARLDQYICDFGAAFTQATTTNARRGFIGVDIFAGKMITNNICLGVTVGHDIVSWRNIDTLKERMAVVPFLIKTKYFIDISPMIQLYASAGAGVYRTIPHLSTKPIGDIWFAGNHPGGSVGIGVDYWFLLMQGVGFAFEYNLFDTDGDEIFSYFAVRVDYCFIKF
jgi:hypothetical protein